MIQWLWWNSVHVCAHASAVCVCTYRCPSLEADALSRNCSDGKWLPTRQCQLSGWVDPKPGVTAIVTKFLSFFFIWEVVLSILRWTFWPSLTATAAFSYFIPHLSNKLLVSVTIHVKHSHNPYVLLLFFPLMTAPAAAINGLQFINGGLTDIHTHRSRLFSLFSEKAFLYFFLY